MHNQEAMQPAPTTRPDWRAACRTLPKNGLYVLVFNTVIAALLTGLGIGGGGFGSCFVYSQSIGLTAWLLADGTRRLLWPNRPVPTPLLIVLFTVSMLVGWLGGTTFAAYVLGHPQRSESYLTSLLVTAAAGFIATMYFWERQRLADLQAAAAQDKSRAETVERQVAEAQLRLLQAQIEPHFLFNTLANVHALIPLDGARAQQMLGHLDGFLRAALAAARKERNTLADEFALLRSYLEILGIRMGERLRFKIDLPEALAAVPVPPMLLQPLVENALKHGLEPKIDGGRVDVSAHESENFLYIQISDTGLGLGNSPIRGSGVGLAHVRQRLAAAYGDRASFKIENNSPNGVTVSIKIPL
jgi:signal transduction histidine kinase